MLRLVISWPLALAALAVGLSRPETATSELDRPVPGHCRGDRRWLAVPPPDGADRLARHGATNMDTLIALGTLAALAVCAGRGGGPRRAPRPPGWQQREFAARLHGVMAPVVVATSSTGRAVEARVRGRASAALHSLLSLRPPTARVVKTATDDGELVAPETVPVGALVKVFGG